jgi:Calcineurin-like phosphoesterase
MAYYLVFTGHARPRRLDPRTYSLVARASTYLSIFPAFAVPTLPIYYHFPSTESVVGMFAIYLWTQGTAFTVDRWDARYVRHLGPLIIGPFQQRIQTRLWNLSVSVVCIGVAGVWFLLDHSAATNSAKWPIVGWPSYILVLTAILPAITTLGLVHAIRFFRVSNEDNDGAVVTVVSAGAHVLESRDAVGHGATIAHWSDLHITGSDTDCRVDVKVASSPNNRLIQLIQDHSDTLKGVDALLVTGDMTDAGRAQEWKRFFEIYQMLPIETQRRTILVPGNHDINVTDRRFWYMEDETSQVRNSHLIRFLAAANMIQGERTKILSESGWVSLSEYLRDIQGQLISFCEGYRYVLPLRFSSGIDLIRLPDKVWNDVFPMIVELPAIPLIIVVCDSNSLTSNPISNAFGSMEERQLQKLKTILAQYEGYPIVIGLHHHAGLPREISESFLGRFSTFVKANLFTSVLGLQRKYVIFNGHRHIGYVGKIGNNLSIISAPSTSIGNENTTLRSDLGGFGVYGISWTENNSVSLLWERWYN